MKIHRSNRTERLAESLGRLLAEEPLDPMATEVVVVQGRGMERWLSLQLAERLGVIANFRFPFPRTVIEEILTASLGETEAKASSRYRPESLVFDLLDLLPELLPDPRFSELASYLAEAPLDRGRPIAARAHALCSRIAGVFDRYFTYRPDLVLRWLAREERGSEVGWQPVLLRALRERIGGPSFPELAQRALARLEDPAISLEALWPRLSLFGLSTLPPLYVRLLGAVSRHRPVHLFLLCPSSHYWGDIFSHREELRALARAGFEKSAEELSLSKAHPLLHSFGAVGRDFQLVVETELEGYESAELFEDPPRTSLLSILQSDLLTLNPPEPEPVPEATSEPDGSIEIHACHGKTRQVEILREVLVRLFEELPDLQPRDVVVMAPDIDELAPIIDAVFSDGDERGHDRAGFPRLPFRIADRPASHENPVAEALIALLDLARSRMRAPDVLAFFARDPVSRKFGFDSQDLATIRRWLDETAVRWGESGEHRASQGVPIGDEQSFREGLDRMLLGHAMRSEGSRLFEGKLGYEAASDTRLLGALIDATDRLFSTVGGLREPASLSEFRDHVDAAMEALFDTQAGDRWQAQAVRDALSELVEAQGDLATRLEFSPEALARLVEPPLRGASSDSFASGAITFCAMVPMRSVPFRVVCLLGMDDGAFPRRTTKEGFDFTAHSHRPGDRKLEDDDRYLFLEALLSARDRFIVFHSGRSMIDNQKLPAAVPISELLDAIAQTMPMKDEASERERRAEAERRFVTEHPLQPFGPASFQPGDAHVKTRSYDRRRLLAARALVEAPSPPRPFFEEPLDIANVESISIDELARFFADPSRAFFNERLGIRFRDEEAELDDRERLELDALERWKVHDTALDLLREGIEPSGIESILRARSILPFGVAGKVSARKAIEAVSGFREAVRGFEEGGRREPIAVDLEIGGMRIVGRLRDLHEKGRLRATWSGAKASRRIEEWVRHVVYCVSEGEAARSSVLVEREGKTEPHCTLWQPLSHAREILEELVLLWKEGQRAPLLFFAEPAQAFASELANTKLSPEDREASAVDKAWQAWSVRKGNPADAPPALCEQPHNARLFANVGRELFTNDFVWPSPYRFPELVETLWVEANEGTKVVE